MKLNLRGTKVTYKRFNSAALYEGIFLGFGVDTYDSCNMPITHSVAIIIDMLTKKTVMVYPELVTFDDVIKEYTNG